MDTPGMFGEWLKQRRKALDLTREELAERAGCSVFALRKIESGERRPSKQLAGLLAAALEIDEQEQAIFIRVARGDLSLERLRSPNPHGSLNSLSDLLTTAHPREDVPFQSDLEPVTSYLPLPATPLLGRESELAALERLFKDPECRLLTLTGTGGIGKTRLAIEFAVRQQAMFSNGVFYVSLAPVSSSDSIVQAIAGVLGCSFSGPVDLKEQLIKHMSIRMKRPALLILDNLEHLIAQSSRAVEMVAEFLRRLPHIKILTTSRERLNLHGEWMYELHGLPVPPADIGVKLDDYSAALLFMHSARRIYADFEISHATENEVVQICRLLEGVPLAIELAAAWVGVLTCGEIAQEIKSNIDFLSTTIRDIPERHRSLRATFEHSWKLLSAAERDALSRLSIFRGGFDRSAAEKVADATLTLLASLVSKSLVRRAETGRYDLHEVIRQYALSYLQEDLSQLNATCDRHSEYYLEFVRIREKALKSSAQQDAMRELMREMDNIRAAWVWAIQRKQFVELGRSVRSLGWMFEVAGLLREGIDQLEQLTQALKQETQSESWGKTLGTALVHQGLLYFRKGQFLHSQKLYQESLAILRPIGDPLLLADALVFLGIITHLNGNYDMAQTLLQEGLACAQAAKDPWFAATASLNLGYIDSQRGFYEEGYQRMMQGLETWRALGDPHSIAMGLNFMVPTLIDLGRFEEAKASMYESIALCERTRNRWGTGTAYRFLGLVLAEQGQYTEAKAQLHKSLDIFSEYVEGWDIARTLSYLGDVNLKAAELLDARTLYLDALSLAVNSQATPIAIDCLVGLAQVDLQTGEIERAYELFRFVLHHPASTEEAKARARFLLLEVEPCLRKEQIEAVHATREAQSLESITAWLLMK